MSIVIAKKVKNGFILGADRYVTIGSMKGTTQKIFKARKENDMYIGVVGYLRDLQLLRTASDLLDVNAIRRENLTEDSIIEYTIPQIRKLMKDNDRYIVDKEGETGWNSHIIIAYKDKAFEITPHFVVREITDFTAIGSPQDFATGSYKILKDTNSKLSDFDMVESIIETTIANNGYVGYPIDIIDTSKDIDFTVIDAEITIKKTPTTKKDEVNKNGINKK